MQSREQDPYPHGVTPEVRAEIDGYRSQRKSLEVSVALYIVTTDAKEVFDKMVDETLKHASELTDEEKFNTAFSIYQICFSYALPSLALLHACGESLPENPSQSENEAIFRYMKNQISQRLAQEKELTMTEVEGLEVVHQAEDHLFVKKTIDLFKSNHPLKALDTFVKLEYQDLAAKLKGDPQILLALRMAMVEGKQRFHEIFNDMQQPLSKSTLP